MSYDERNSVRYLETFNNLDDLSARPLDEARNAAAIDDATLVTTFFSLVNDQISMEHREWVMLKRLAPDLSLNRLRTAALPGI